MGSEMCIRDRCVAYLHRCNETGKFVFATDGKCAVCFDEKRMEKVFRRFCRFIIMLESGVIFELNKFAYEGCICSASSSRKDYLSNGQVLVTTKKRNNKQGFLFSVILKPLHLMLLCPLNCQHCHVI